MLLRERQSDFASEVMVNQKLMGTLPQVDRGGQVSIETVVLRRWEV